MCGMSSPQRAAVRSRRYLALLGIAAASPAAAWWNCAWTSRIALDVSNTGSTQTNVIVETTLNATQLPNYGWTGNDNAIRVVDTDDQTLLTHYTEPRPVGLQRLHLWFRIPSLASGTRRVFVYYGNATAPNASTDTLFTSAGVRMLTRRNTTGDPASLAAFLTAFDAASQPAGYGCSVLPNYVARSNTNVFGANQNIHFSTLFFLEVPAAQAGNWRIRYGPDFGLGGGLYARGSPLQEVWNDDLWWNNSFANTGEILQGTVNLAAGRHLIAGYGSEGCCDGTTTIQLQRPGTTTWLDATTANFALVAPICPTAGVTAVRAVDSIGLAVRKTSVTAADPANAALNPKAIPGARVRYAIRLTNGGAAQTVDADSLTVTDRVPANTALVVSDIAGANSGPIRFIDGSPPSGLSYSFGGLGSTTDDVEFSNNNAASFGYTPTAAADGTDAAVTHVRVRLRGQPVCATANAPRSADLEFDVLVR